MITIGPISSPECHGDTHPCGDPPGSGNVGLNVVLNPYRCAPPRRSPRQWTIVGITMSGANGSDAMTPHGAIVPSSGPSGTPRALYPKNRHGTSRISRVTLPGPSLAVIPQRHSPYSAHRRGLRIADCRCTIG